MTGSSVFSKTEMGLNVERMIRFEDKILGSGAQQGSL